MVIVAARPVFVRVLALLAFVLVSSGGLAVSAVAQSAGFKIAVAESAASDKDLAEFYRARDYKPLWTSSADRARRTAFLKALSGAADHGLPVKRYDGDQLAALFRSARTDQDRGRAEVEASRMFVQYAQDIQTGVLTPSAVDDDIKRRPPRRDRLAQLVAFSKSSPRGYLRNLTPKSPEYNRLLAEKLRLERVLGQGGWGAEVPGTGALKPGENGARVVALRDRLIAMGYLKRTATQTYDATLQKAVQAFQLDHGLFADGVAGEVTLKEINQPASLRLQQVIVAMERERWMGDDRGGRHVLVNITDYHARIMENDKVLFQTRSVVGQNSDDRRTPEFSDVMDHMIINPTWNVPRSIATKEYLPLLKKNPHAVNHLRLINASGQVVSRSAVDFSQFNERNFPFNMKEPPSQGNALGLVKFMFPNPYNIYLHDTPQKSLFAREARAFSHGCIRLNDPFDFAYALLDGQVADPEAFFHEKLETRRETQVNLARPLPVHIIYRTAQTQPKGRVQFRRDVYGRDARIFAALNQAGVALRAVRG